MNFGLRGFEFSFTSIQFDFDFTRNFGEVSAQQEPQFRDKCKHKH